MRERPPTFVLRRMMEGGAPGGPEQDPGVGRDLTRDPGPLPPTLLSGAGRRGETGTGAETAAETAVETGAGIRVEDGAGI